MTSVQKLMWLSGHLAMHSAQQTLHCTNTASPALRALDCGYDRLSCITPDPPCRCNRIESLDAMS